MLLLSGCIGKHPDKLKAGDYIRYVENPRNALKGTVHSGIWNYDFQYKPSAYITLRESDPTHSDTVSFRKRTESLDRSVWFNVAISVKGEAADPLKYNIRDINEYNARLSYFLSSAAQNFHLYYGNQGEMKQIGYYFENNYSIKPVAVAVIGFSIPDTVPREPVTIEYQDRLFNAGILKFNIAPAAFKNIPRLSI